MSRRSHDHESTVKALWGHFGGFIVLGLAALLIVAAFAWFFVVLA